MTSDDRTPGRTAVARRPQELVRALLGVVDADLGCSQPIPLRAYLEVLAQLGVSEVACRATLSRMANKGALERSQQGRSVAFRASPHTRDLLFRDRRRILSSRPFEPRRRLDRAHVLRPGVATRRPASPPHTAELGRVRTARRRTVDRPRSPDLDDVLIEVQDPADPSSSITVFDAVPRLPTRAEDVIARAWNLPVLRAEHETFLREWEEVGEGEFGAVGHPLGAERGLDPAPSRRPGPSRSVSPR